MCFLSFLKVLSSTSTLVEVLLEDAASSAIIKSFYNSPPANTVFSGGIVRSSLSSDVKPEEGSLSRSVDISRIAFGVWTAPQDDCYEKQSRSSSLACSDPCLSELSRHKFTDEFLKVFKD